MKIKLMLLGLVAVSASGCATQNVKAWERGNLAQPVMAWEADPLMADYRNHVQTSKEAASGGASLGGGGCGCN